MKHSNNDLNEVLLNIYNDLSCGLLYTHVRVNANAVKTLESSSFLYALIEILNEKGLITVEELDERKKQVAERLVESFVKSGIGLLYQDSECDKYTFKQEAHVDCQGRLHICKAICCKLPFALSKQDVEERVIRWEFGRPYLIAHDADGYCVHLDRVTYRCTVHEHRPVPCRGFDCQDNERWHVWLDYDEKTLNPEIIEKCDQSNDKAYACLKMKQMKLKSEANEEEKQLPPQQSAVVKAGDLT